MDFAVLRRRMVEEQLLGRGIRDEKILGIFRKIERHRFIPEALRHSAYGDFPLSIGEGQTISQPYMVALMTECLSLSGTEKILEVGTGSGYQTAILAEVSKEVCSIERIDKLAKGAGALLKTLGYANIRIKTGDGTLGWPEEAPFDRIIVTAASPEIPFPLIEQLKEGGRIVLPLGESFSQVLKIVEKKEGKLVPTDVCSCVFVPLIGRYGYEDTQ